jgi:hypothetical protein
VLVAATIVGDFVPHKEEKQFVLYDRTSNGAAPFVIADGGFNGLAIAPREEVGSIEYIVRSKTFISRTSTYSL